jgi:hypothetical protein
MRFFCPGFGVNRFPASHTLEAAQVGPSWHIMHTAAFESVCSALICCISWLASGAEGIVVQGVLPPRLCSLHRGTCHPLGVHSAGLHTPHPLHLPQPQQHAIQDQAEDMGLPVSPCNSAPRNKGLRGHCQGASSNPLPPTTPHGPGSASPQAFRRQDPGRARLHQQPATQQLPPATKQGAVLF